MNRRSIIGVVMGLLLVAGLPMAFAQSDDEITRQNISDLSIVATIEANRAEQVDLSNSGTLLAVAEGFNEIRVYDVDAPQQPKLLLTVPDFGVQSIDISPNEQFVAAGTTEGRIYIVDIDAGEFVATLEGHAAYVWDVAWSPDGDRIASAGDDSTILIWDVPDGESPLRLEGHLDWVRAVAWSPDGDRLVSGSDDQTLRIWDTSNGNPVNALGGHFDWIRDVAWSQNGSLLVSASDDGLVMVWDAEVGTQLNSLVGHDDFVRSVAIGVDGDVIFSASDDSTVRVWGPGNTDSLATVLEGEFVQYLTIDMSEDGTRLAIGGTDGRIIVLGIN